jgi:hypothetical protein
MVALLRKRYNETTNQLIMYGYQQQQQLQSSCSGNHKAATVSRYTDIYASNVDEMTTASGSTGTTAIQLPSHIRDATHMEATELRMDISGERIIKAGSNALNVRRFAPACTATFQTNIDVFPEVIVTIPPGVFSDQTNPVIVCDYVNATLKAKQTELRGQLLLKQQNPLPFEDAPLATTGLCFEHSDKHLQYTVTIQNSDRDPVLFVSESFQGITDDVTPHTQFVSSSHEVVVTISSIHYAYDTLCAYPKSQFEADDAFDEAFHSKFIESLNASVVNWPFGGMLKWKAQKETGNETRPMGHVYSIVCIENSVRERPYPTEFGLTLNGCTKSATGRGMPFGMMWILWNCKDALSQLYYPLSKWYHTDSSYFMKSTYYACKFTPQFFRRPISDEGGYDVSQLRTDPDFGKQIYARMRYTPLAKSSKLHSITERDPLIASDGSYIGPPAKNLVKTIDPKFINSSQGIGWREQQLKTILTNIQQAFRSQLPYDYGTIQVYMDPTTNKLSFVNAPYGASPPLKQFDISSLSATFAKALGLGNDLSMVVLAENNSLAFPDEFSPLYWDSVGPEQEMTIKVYYDNSPSVEVKLVRRLLDNSQESGSLKKVKIVENLHSSAFNFDTDIQPYGTSLKLSLDSVEKWYTDRSVRIQTIVSRMQSQFDDVFGENVVVLQYNIETQKITFKLLRGSYVITDGAQFVTVKSVDGGAELFNALGMGQRTSFFMRMQQMSGSLYAEFTFPEEFNVFLWNSCVSLGLPTTGICFENIKLISKNTQSPTVFLNYRTLTTNIVPLSENVNIQFQIRKENYFQTFKFEIDPRKMPKQLATALGLDPVWKPDEKTYLDFDGDGNLTFPKPLNLAVWDECANAGITGSLQPVIIENFALQFPDVNYNAMSIQDFAVTLNALLQKSVDDQIDVRLDPLTKQLHWSSFSECDFEVDTDTQKTTIPLDILGLQNYKDGTPPIKFGRDRPFVSPCISVMPQLTYVFVKLTQFDSTLISGQNVRSTPKGFDAHFAFPLDIRASDSSMITNSVWQPGRFLIQFGRSCTVGNFSIVLLDSANNVLRNTKFEMVLRCYHK